MISVEGENIKLKGNGLALAIEFAQLYSAMNRRMPEVVDRALDILENTDDEDFEMKIIKEEHRFK